jgi:HrpA-like RNA helicase
MPLPTLLREGFVVPRAGLSKSEKDCIKNMRSIDYIINFLSDRIPIAAGNNPKIPAKSPGDKVIVLKSETGSGKSTVLAPFLYETFQTRVNKNIAITQPRVLTTIDICTKLPENYPFLKMDENLGYMTGDFKRRPSSKGIIFMTHGILLQQLKITPDEQFIKAYSFILVDEVHDRQMDVDMSLFLLKKFLAANYKDPNCPFVILMSATFKPIIFTEYFDTPKENLINVVGSSFPIEANFLKYDNPDFIKKAVATAEQLHIKNISDVEENQYSRDILIFVKGTGPSRDILKKLHIFNASVLSKGFEHVLAHTSEGDADHPPEKNASSSSNNGKGKGSGDGKGKGSGDGKGKGSGDGKGKGSGDGKGKGKGSGDGKGWRGDRKGGAPAEDSRRFHIAPIELSRTSFYSGGAEYQNLFSDIGNISVPIYKLTDKGDVSPEIDRWVKPTRRIIVATNIAETGVTIESLKYCIDTGFVNNVEFNPDFGVEAMFTKGITKGMATQRKGRVGRLAPGHWYPIYTEDTFKALDEDQFADILTKDMTESMLNILIKETETTLVENDSQHITPKLIEERNMFLTNYMTNQRYHYFTSLKSLNMASVDFLESPSANSLNFAMEKLHGLAFIGNDLNPTILGMYAFRFRKITVENRRFLLAGYAHGANILDLITIVAFIETRRMNTFHRKYQPINMFKKKLSDAEYEFYYKIVIADEMVEYILVWEYWSEFLNEIIIKMNKTTGQSAFYTKMMQQWCVDHKLTYEGLMQVVATRDELIESFISMGINPYYNGLGIDKGSYNLLNMFRESLEDFTDEVQKIKKCIMDGYRFNLCLWDDSTKKYILHYRSIPVSIRSNVNTRMGDDAVQTNPNYLILSNIMMRESQKNKGMYEFESTGSVSVMDSYVDVDVNFLKH